MSTHNMFSWSNKKNIYLNTPLISGVRIVAKIILKSKNSVQKLLIFFLFLNKNICCGYSLEAPWGGVSNEYPQHVFLLRNKKIITWILPLIWSYTTNN